MSGRDQAIPEGASQWRETTQAKGFDPAQVGKMSGQGFTGAPRQQWITGQNLESTESGWNTQFFDKFVKDYNAAQDRGEGLDYFRQKRDGIALWDDQEAGIKFGDVFSGGRKVENLYEKYGQSFADQVMIPFVMSGDEQARLGKDGSKLPRESLQDRRRELSENAARARSTVSNQEEFNRRVDAEQDSWDEGVADAVTRAAGVAGGAVTGAAAGGAAGAVFGGIGALPGALIGGLVGGATGFIGAHTNEDELQAMAARGEVMADMAAERFGEHAGLAQRLQSWAGLAGKAMNPLGNIVHGAADGGLGAWAAVDGAVVGDRDAGFYATDAEGDTKRGWGYTAADLGANVAAGITQFASPVGRGLYMAQMGLQISGSALGLVTTGATWDDRIADFDNIWENEDKQLDLGAGAAAYGALGVDVVQLGLGAGLSKVAKGLAGGTLDDAAAAATGAQKVTAAGRVFTVENGVATKSRLSWSVLAPSEWVNLGTTRIMAMMNPSATRTALKADALYKASLRYSNEMAALPMAMITGMGEGLEEGVQAVLEARSHGRNVDWIEVRDSALAGASMGLGMGLGATVARVPKAERDRRLVNVMRKVDGLEELSSDAWKKMSAEQRAAAAQTDTLSAKVTKASVEALAQEQQMEYMASDPFANRALGAAEAAYQLTSQSATPGGDNTRVLVQSYADVEDHVVEMSLNTTLQDFASRAEGLRQQIETLTDETARQQTERVLQQVNHWRNRLERDVAKFYDANTSEAEQERMVRSLNWAMRRAWQVTPGDEDSEAKAIGVTSLLARFPIDNPGSMHTLLPQVNYEFSVGNERFEGRGRGDGVYGVSAALAETTGHDYDGDKMKMLIRIILDKQLFRGFRQGAFMRTANTKHPVAVSTTAYEKNMVALLSDQLRDPDPKAPGRVAAENTVKTLGRRLRGRFRDVQAGPMINDFLRSLELGKANAKEVLLTSLAQKRATAMQDWSDRAWENPWMAINSILRAELHSFQRTVAGHRAATAAQKITANDPAQAEAYAKHREREVKRAATFTEWLWTLVPGGDIFRNWQALSYSAVRSSDLAAAEIVREGDVFTSMSQWYVEFSSGQAEAQADVVLARDGLQRRAVQTLMNYVSRTEDPSQASKLLAVVANTSVPEFELDAQGAQPRYTGKQISMLQWLLRQEIQAEKARYAGAMTPEMESKHTSLLGKNAMETFVEVFGAYRLDYFLGRDAAPWVGGGGQTVSELTFRLRGMDEQSRSMNARVIREFEEYSRKDAEHGRHNQPYRIEDDKGNKLPALSAYQSVMDSIVGAANNFLTWDGSKAPVDQLGGRKGDQARRVSEKFRTKHTELHAHLLATGVQMGSFSEVKAFADQNPSLMKAYLGLISDKAVLQAIDPHNNKVARWVVEALAEPNSKRAEMKLWRGALLAEWAPLQNRLEKDPSKRGVSAYDITNRWHLKMYELAKLDDRKPLDEFIQHLEGAQDIHDFEAWVNNPESNIRHRGEAPFTAWGADLSEVDPTFQDGRISVISEGAQFREAMSEFEKQVDRFVMYENSEARRRQADLVVLTALRAHRAAELAATTDAERKTADKGGMLAELRRRIEIGLRAGPALGPRAMYEAAVQNLMVMANMTDKGKTPPHTAPFGAMDMMRFQREFSTAEEATANSITANSLTSMLRTPWKLVGPMRLMDDHGNTIEWPGLTIDTILDMYEAHPDMMRAMLFPSVLESTPSGGLDQRFVIGSTLDELLQKNATKDLLFGNSARSKAIMLSVIDSLTPEHEMQQLLDTYVVAKTSNLTQSIVSVEQAEDLVSESRRVIADTIRALVPAARQDNKVAMQVADSSAPGGIRLVTPAKRSDAALMAAYETFRELVNQPQSSLMKQLATFREVALLQLQDHLADARIAGDTAREAELVAEIDRYKTLFTRDVLPAAVSMYGLQKPGKGVSDAQWLQDNEATLLRLRDYTASRGDLIGTSPYRAVAKLWNNGKTADADTLTPAEWLEVSSAVVMHMLTSKVSVSDPSIPNVDAGTSLEDLKYFDPTYKFLFDMLKSDSPIMQAALQLFGDYKADDEKLTTTETANQVARMFLKEDRITGRPPLGPISQPVSVHMVQSVNRIKSSGAEPGIKSGGLVPQRHYPWLAASARNYDVPDSELLTKMTFTGQEALQQYARLQKNKPATLKMVRPAGATTHPGSEDLFLLDGRFVERIVFKVNGVEVFSNKNPQDTPAARNLLVRHRRDPRFAEYQAAANSGFLHLTRLQSAIRSAATKGKVSADKVEIEVDFYHPDDQPVEMANNIAFEGIASLGDDYYDVLGASPFVGHGGIDQNASTTALSAAKESKAALRKAVEAGQSIVEALEDGWRDDISEVMRRKTWFEINENGINPDFFNGWLKHFQMRHVVRVPNADGGYTVLSFEQARAAQRAGKALPPEAELVSMSVGAMALLHGAVDPWAFNRLTSIEDISLDIASVRPWTGDLSDPIYRDRLPGLFEKNTVSIFDAAHSAALVTKELGPTSFISPEQTARTNRGFTARAARAVEVLQARNKEFTDDTYQKAGKNYVDQLTMSRPQLNAAQVLASAGVNSTLADTATLNDLVLTESMRRASEFAEARTNRLPHVYIDSLPQGGVQSNDIGFKYGPESLQAGGPVRATDIAPHDPVVVAMEYFPDGATERVAHAIRALVGLGADVALTGLPGQDPLRDFAEDLLRNYGYAPIAGQPGMFVASDDMQDPVTLSALESTRVAMSSVDMRNMLLAFIDRESSYEENTGELLGALDDLVAEYSDLLPTARTGFSLLKGADHARGMLILQDPDVRSALLEQTVTQDQEYKEFTASKGKSGPKLAARRRAEITDAFDRSYDKMLGSLNVQGTYDAGTWFQVGDMIPLMNSLGNIMLYRHGMEAPSRQEIAELSATFPRGETKVFAYKAVEAENITARSGHVREFRDDSRVGLELIVDVPLSDIGTKDQLHYTGFKVLLTTSGRPPATPMVGGMAPRVVINAADAKSKELVTLAGFNARNMITMLGVDFREDVAWTWFKDKSPESLAKVKQLLIDWRASQTVKYSSESIQLMMESTNPSQVLLDALDQFSPGQSVPAASQLAAALQGSRVDPEARITQAILTYLLWEGADVNDVLDSPGLGDPNVRRPDMGLWQMPSLFTSVFDRLGNDDPLRAHLRDKLQSRIQSESGQGYSLNLDWTVDYVAPDPADSRFGVRLVLAKLAVAPQNPITDDASRARTQTQGSMAQLQQVGLVPIGARLALKKDTKKLQATLNRSGVTDIQTGSALYAALRNVRSEPHVRLPLLGTSQERQYARDHREAIDQFRNELPQTEWGTPAILKYRDARNKVAAQFGIPTDQAHILDYWVRQVAAKPTLSSEQRKNLSKEQQAQLENMVELGAEDALDFLGLVADNLSNGWLPTTGSAVSGVTLMDLAALYQFSMNSKKFRLRTDLDDPNSVTEDWSDWVKVAFAVGSMPNERALPGFQPYVDAIRHTYLDSGVLFSSIPTSTDEIIQEMLADPSMSLYSTNPDRARLLRMNPVERLLWNADPKRETPLTKVDRRELNWRKKNKGASLPAGLQTTRNLVERGNELIDRVNTQGAALRIALHMRATLALLNPLLLPGAVVEGTHVRVLETLTSLATGTQSQLGPLAPLDNLAKKLTDGELKLSPLTPEQRAADRQLYSLMGRDSDFISMVNDDYRMHIELNNAGRFEAWLAKLAKFAGKIQDVGHGFRMDLTAKRYMNAVYAVIDTLGIMSPISIDRLQLEMKQNRTYVRDMLPPIHEMAMNTLKNIKCVKRTTASAVASRIEHRLMTSGIPGTVVGTTLLMKMPFMFFNYATNTTVRLGGLQGPDAWLAAMLTGREKGWIGRKFYNAFHPNAKREEQGEEVHDFLEVLEGVDLSKQFVKSGISWTGLFLLGSLGSMAGLTGEDEEDKRRRRIAEATGAAYLYDPRDVVNDFRNADAIYFDNIPFLSDIFRVLPNDESGEGGRSMANMNFIMKQVLSPVLGMARFFETGEPLEILWGFEDAFTSMPLISTMLWDDAAHVYTELVENAETAGTTGRAEDIPETMRFLLGGVAHLERMLLESSFINQLYAGADRYDRDNYKMVDHGEDGTVIKNRLGEPVALKAYGDEIDPVTGEKRSFTVSRSPMDAYAHELTEKRATLAVLGTILSLGKGDFLRTQMPVKERKFGKKELTADQFLGLIETEADRDVMADGKLTPEEAAEAVVRAVWRGGQTFESLNLDGFYMSRETRQALDTKFRNDFIKEGIELGLTEKQATARAKRLFMGPWENPMVPSLEDIIWSKNAYQDTISYKESTSYYQLNTTYVKGPDGNYWATGVSRDLLETGFGFAPFQKYLDAAQGMGMDERLNATDAVRGLNTGMRGLMRVEEDFDQSSREDDSGGGNGTNNNNNANNGNGWVDYGNGRGWRNFGRRGGGRGGGGGGGSFTRLNAPQDNQTPYTNRPDRIDLNNPLIRRADIRRERTDSEKGRLKPWQ